MEKICRLGPRPNIIIVGEGLQRPRGNAVIEPFL